MQAISDVQAILVMDLGGKIVNDCMGVEEISNFNDFFAFLESNNFQKVRRFGDKVCVVVCGRLEGRFVLGKRRSKLNFWVCLVACQL